MMLSASGRCACPDDLRYRSGIGGKPVSTQALLKQLVGLGVGKDIKHQQAGRLYRGKAGQLVAAGHHYPAGQRARQQRAHLRFVVGVVENDEHPFPGQQAAVQAGLRVKRARYPIRCDSERL